MGESNDGEDGGLAVVVVGGGGIDFLGGRLGDGPFLWVTVDLRRGGSDGGSFSVVGSDGWLSELCSFLSVVAFWCSGYSVFVI